MAPSLQEVETLIAQRNAAEAATMLEKLIARKKQRGTDWPRAIALAQSLGDEESVLKAAAAWAAEAPGDPARQLKQVEALAGVARHGDAAKLARKLQRNPNARADAFYFEGIMRTRFGERDDAIDLFYRALEARPDHTPAWEQIALLDGFKDRGADIEKMHALAAGALAQPLRAPLRYAIARAHDKAGNIEDAFANYAEGAAIIRKSQPFALEPQLNYMERLKATFTAPLIDSMRDQSDRGAGFIFIVGPPRSGTTLVEQILSTARSVTPTGEHLILRLATHPLGNLEPQEVATAQQFSGETWRAMAVNYQRRVARRFGAAACYTDKSMLAHYFLGVIRALFPAAKIVRVSRNLADVAWSCHRSRLSGNRWAYDLDLACRYLKAHDALMDHWSGIDAIDLHHLRYEDLITKPEETTQSLFAHCNLERPADWDAFHQRQNPVATASVAQVRRPLYADAVNAWQRYDRFLKPVFERHFPALMS